MREFISVDQIETVHVDSCEAETSVGWYRGDDNIHIFTSDNTTLTRLKKCMIKNPEGWKCYESGRDRAGFVMGYNFIAPKKALRFVGGNEKSEEQKAAASKRMKERLASGWLPGQSAEEEEDDE